MGWSPNTSSDPWTETQTPNITLTPASVHPAGCEKGNREKKIQGCIMIYIVDKCKVFAR